MPPLVLRLWLFVVGLCLLAAPAGRAADAVPVTAEWRIDTKQSPVGLPTSRLDLVVNGRQVVPIEPAERLGDYRVIPRRSFASAKIPAKALCACQSNVVNSGVFYYVVPAGKDRLALYRQYDDVGGPTGYKKVRTIPVEPR